MKAFIAFVAAGMLAVVLVAVAAPPAEGEETEAHSNSATNDHAAATHADEHIGDTDVLIAAKPPRDEQHKVATNKVITSPGPVAKDFTLAMGNGREVTLSDLQGKVVVLDFWATWCGPCKMALPYVDAFSKWTKDSDYPIEVFAVHTMGRQDGPATVSAVAQYWQQQNFDTLVLFDYTSAVARSYSVSSIPTTVIIGPDGRIFSRHVGYDRNRNMTEMLKEECLKALGE